jgi:hypothetical protein
VDTNLAKMQKAAEAAKAMAKAVTSASSPSDDEALAAEMRKLGLETYIDTMVTQLGYDQVSKGLARVPLYDHVSYCAPHSPR